MTIDEAKKELEAVKVLNATINIEQRHLDKLRRQMYDLQSVRYDEDRVQTSRTTDVSDIIANIEMLQGAINSYLDELVDLKRLVLSKITQMEKLAGYNDIYGVILRLRYIEGMYWSDIFKEVGYEESAVYQKHREALEKYAEI